MPRAAQQRNLRLLPGGLGQVRPDPRCQIASQAVMAGDQDHRVTGANAQMTGRGHGILTIRVGRVLIYLEDREALQSWVKALRRARELEQAAFGPEMPPPAYEPRRLK